VRHPPMLTAGPASICRTVSEDVTALYGPAARMRSAAHPVPGREAAPGAGGETRPGDLLRRTAPGSAELPDGAESSRVNPPRPA
jgi:hypothetical protein